MSNGSIYAYHISGSKSEKGIGSARRFSNKNQQFLSVLGAVRSVALLAVLYTTDIIISNQRSAYFQIISSHYTVILSLLYSYSLQVCVNLLDLYTFRDERQ